MGQVYDKYVQVVDFPGDLHGKGGVFIVKKSSPVAYVDSEGLIKVNLTDYPGIFKLSEEDLEKETI